MPRKIIKKESDVARAAFELYCSMPLDGDGRGRSLRRLTAQLRQKYGGKGPSLATVENWSTSFGWDARTEAVDREADAAARKRMVQLRSRKKTDAIIRRMTIADTLYDFAMETLYAQLPTNGSIDDHDAMVEAKKRGDVERPIVPFLVTDNRDVDKALKAIALAAKLQQMDLGSGTDLDTPQDSGEPQWVMPGLPDKDFLKKVFAFFNPGETDAKKRASMMLPSGEQHESKDHEIAQPGVGGELEPPVIGPGYQERGRFRPSLNPKDYPKPSDEETEEGE